MLHSNHNTIQDDEAHSASAVEVRKWTWDDFPEMCALARDVSRRYGEGDLAHYFAPEPRDMYAHTLRLFAERVGWVAVKDGKIVGAIALDTMQQDWNLAFSHLVNSHFWIDPEHRSGGVAATLIDRAREFAIEMGVPLRIDITMGQENPALVDRFMRSKGFNHTGGLHWYVPPPKETE